MCENEVKRELNWKLFENPTAPYRSAPFWAWNCRLDKEQLKRQLECLKEMGFGGVHIHSRTGMDTKYLSEEYFELVEECRVKACELGLQLWLYDEDRWPSGSAGGYVTREKKYRARHLLFTPEKKVENEDRWLLAAYDIVLDDAGCLQNNRRLSEDELGEGDVWFAYLELEEESQWHNNQTYVNTLDKAAIDEFCRITHEAYASHFEQYFGTQIPAIFTDEPRAGKKSYLGFAQEKSDVRLPWTDDLPETFRENFGQDLLAGIPELIWNLPEGRISQIRYQYHAHITERFTEAYTRNLGQWCEEHRLKLTGHLLDEPTLKGQTGCIGEIMGPLSEFQLPGIDILCDRKEYTTAKQAQSIARQFGREGVMAELYGVNGWELDFRSQKLQTDWLSALGVTSRAPHLSWVSMGGEAKRDYPAPFNYQSPWHTEYKLMEDHISRINVLMKKGQPLVRVAVIHPVESCWLSWGPQEQDGQVRKYLDDQFRKITEWLLFGQIDFDFISESLLPKQCEEAGFPMQVGMMRYEAVIVPGCMTLRSTTVKRLAAFAQAGGTVLFAGGYPNYVDAVACDTAMRTWADQEACEAGNMEWKVIGSVIPFDEYHLLSQLEESRDIDIRRFDGERADDLLYQLRRDGDREYLFIAHGKSPKPGEEVELPAAKDMIMPESLQILVKGTWKPVLCDTLTGQRNSMKCEYVTGGSKKTAGGEMDEGQEWTRIRITIYAHDSLLFVLEPGMWTEDDLPEYSRYVEMTPFRLGRVSMEMEDAPMVSHIPPQVEIRLSEPNVLVLDVAEYALDQEPYTGEKEELLRLDNALRQKLGMPIRKKQVSQPWILPEKMPAHTLRLRFTIESETEAEQVKLALEQAEETEVSWNGTRCEKRFCGYYVDETIRVLEIGALHRGQNALELIVPFGERTNTENVFLLGDFCVQAEGGLTRLLPPRRKLPFGDITRMGYPFYGGNITYRLEVDTVEPELYIRCPKYRGALIKVQVDPAERNGAKGAEAGSFGYIAFAPYQMKVTGLRPGRHVIELTLFGNRVNTFGALHNANEHFWWHGPEEYRTSRDEWSYEYQLKPVGILKCPEIFSDESYRKVCENMV